jgi:DNA-directed RNA polymerase subunit alpha
MIPISLDSEEPKFLSIDVKGPKVVTAADLGGDPAISVVDPNLPIATLNDEGHLKLQAKVEQGRGYVTADRNFDEAMGIGWIPIDSVHSPVKRVNFKVEPARVGRATDYEKLTLEVHTNGTVEPDEAVSLASMLLRDHLAIFTHAEESMREGLGGLKSEELTGIDKLLAKSIDELDLSVRSANCLKNANIHSLRDLVRRSEKDMLETKNFGRKSLEELEEVLEGLGLAFGMDVPEKSPAVFEAGA